MRPYHAVIGRIELRGGRGGGEKEGGAEVFHGVAVCDRFRTLAITLIRSPCGRQGRGCVMPRLSAFRRIMTKDGRPYLNAANKKAARVGGLLGRYAVPTLPEDGRFASRSERAADAERGLEVGRGADARGVEGEVQQRVGGELVVDVEAEAGLVGRRREIGRAHV